ncbi:MAG: aspartate carbamoyltransferase catalytic subunit [Aerococcus sp.]|nr:aspartate carbamoyltransferase catalytic subunit [Aerococcus sp.]
MESTAFALRNIVSVQDLSNEQVMDLIKSAQAFKRGEKADLPERPRFAANMFFEDSTRTHTSFAVAEGRLGMNVIELSPEHSSIKKGETLADTFLTLDALGVDTLVIRHKADDYYLPLLDLQEELNLNIHLLNGGDGRGQHPSQCLLDLMTIYEEFNHFDGLHVAIVGDIKNSRVARSNAQLLTQLGATVSFSGPEYWYDPSFSSFGEFVPLDDLVEKVDVMMLLRVQHERHNAEEASEQQFSATDYHEKYGINQARYDRLPEQAIICHPGPINRDVEFASELVTAPKSRYVQQMHNGVFMRMAMLEAVMHD